MPKGLIGQLQPDAAVHGRQRGLGRQRARFTGAHLFTADGDEPDVAAARPDGVGVAQQPGVDAGGQVMAGGDHVQLVDHGGQHDQ